MGTWLWFLPFLLLWPKMPSTATATATATESPQVPALFVFGDSLLDPGNNNHLRTLAKANFPPNGIDFPRGVTGRFCNGATLADHLGYLLGLGSIPAFNDPSTTGPDILRGVNLASTSAGILNETGRYLGERIPMFYQVEDFGNTILPQVRSFILQDNGVKYGKFEDYLSKSIIFSNIGNNDFLNNGLLPFIRPVSIQQSFYDNLIDNYIIQLKKLYAYGARKFLVTGMAPLGCIPVVLLLGNINTDQCYEPYNEISRRFNAKIKSMVQQLNNDLFGAHILYWDVYTLMAEVIENPLEYGFTNSHEACCKIVRGKNTIICHPGMHLCPNRSQFVFWDGFHPTDAVNKILADQVYEGIIQSTYPMNVKQLIQL